MHGLSMPSFASSRQIQHASSSGVSRTGTRVRAISQRRARIRGRSVNAFTEKRKDASVVDAEGAEGGLGRPGVSRGLSLRFRPRGAPDATRLRRTSGIRDPRLRLGASGIRAGHHRPVQAGVERCAFERRSRQLAMRLGSTRESRVGARASSASRCRSRERSSRCGRYARNA